EGRIDLNNASAGARSDKLLAFAQLRFIVASYLLGKKTRSKKQIEQDVETLAKLKDPRGELREVFTLIATNLGGLERLQRDRDTGKLLSTRESIDAAADKLLSVMTKPGS